MELSSSILLDLFISSVMIIFMTEGETLFLLSIVGVLAVILCMVLEAMK